jgi:hypothetical protein
MRNIKPWIVNKYIKRMIYVFSHRSVDFSFSFKNSINSLNALKGNWQIMGVIVYLEYNFI